MDKLPNCFEPDANGNRVLDPDEFDLKTAMYKNVLPACPFCGKAPMTSCSYNERSGIFGCTVSCDAMTCGASVHSNSREGRDAARKDAIARWTRRTPAPAPQKSEWTVQEILDREG